jgi:Gram-negative bacterial TonB protein C-terminal
MKSQSRPTGIALVVSVFIHVSAILLLLRFSSLLFSPANTSATAFQDMLIQQDETLYYNLREIHVAKVIPSINSPRKRVKTGRDSHPDPKSTNTVSTVQQMLALAMNPPKPDNTRQTIIQPSSPPDLKITHDVKLPNLLIGSVNTPAIPEIYLQMSAPHAVAKTRPAVVTPTIADKLRNGVGVLASSLPVLQDDPKLAVPVGAMPEPRVQSSQNRANGAGAEDAPKIGQSSGLLAIGVDPSTLEQWIGVPPGNRYAVLSISPTSHRGDGDLGPPHGTGAPSGRGGGDSATTSNAQGTGGNGIGVSQILSLKGGTPSFSGAATVLPAEPVLLGKVDREQIFPVIAPIHPRGLGLQIFTGPTGGGGLAVYHVLPCNKIYSAILPMPGKNWILEYCSAEENQSNQPTESTSVIRLDGGLVGPDAGRRYDFKRPKIPDDKKSNLIVLRGSIESDGSVANISVLSGIDPIVDRLAAAAFRRWKFRPALRVGKPIQVQILVGIPAIGNE